MATKSRSKKVSRSDGKASKEAILDATLIIIMRDGIRNIKYKTVAEVAGVAPSATAYYFHDIPTLIKEAYIHHFKNYKTEMDEVRSLVKQVLKKFDHSALMTEASLERFIEMYTKVLMAVIIPESKSSTDFMLLDRIFRNETLQNPSLYPALKHQDQLDIESIKGVFIALKTPNPEEDATHLMSLLGYLNEKILHEGSTNEMKKYVCKMIKSLLRKSITPANH